MLLQEIYQSYLNSGYRSIKNNSGVSSDDYFYMALLAFSENELDDAVSFAHQANKLDPDNYVFEQGGYIFKKSVKVR